MTLIGLEYTKLFPKNLKTGEVRQAYSLISQWPSGCGIINMYTKFLKQNYRGQCDYPVPMD